MGTPRPRRNPPPVRLVVCLLSAAALSIVAGGYPADQRPRTLRTGPDLPAGSATQLQSTAQKCLAAIDRLDVARLGALTSTDGLVVAERTMDWDRRKRAEQVGGTSLQLRLPDGDCGFWVDQELEFSPRKQLHSPEFLRLLGVFRKQIHEGLPSWWDCDLALVDHWGRHLGPAVGHKRCSGSECYFCFRREGNAWRLYRMESCMH